MIRKSGKVIILSALVVLLCMPLASAANGIQKKVDILVNSLKLYIHGNEVAADNWLYKGTTYIPLREVSERLGFNVEWDKESRSVKITDPDYENGLVPIKKITVFDASAEKYPFLTIENLELIAYNNGKTKISFEFSGSFMPEMAFSLYFYDQNNHKIATVGAGATSKLAIGEKIKVVEYVEGDITEYSRYTVEVGILGGSIYNL